VIDPINDSSSSGLTTGQTRVLHGPRIGREGSVRLSCSMVLLNESRDQVLLTRRADNGEWCLPGGAVDPGESVSETCQREMKEETGLEVQVVRLVGIYSDPDQLVVYPDGNKVFTVVLNFEVEVIGGKLSLSPETTGVKFVPVAKAVNMDLFDNHAVRLRDTLEGKPEVFIR
jgi:8-oxo-dGTP pyrophosphatase MutT (NUDIX family)